MTTKAQTPEPPDLSPPPFDESGLRIPPHSVEAEQALLGALLIDGACFAHIAGAVSAADFYRHEHRLIFGAIESICAAQRDPDIIAVFERLRDSNSTAHAADLAYLNDLAASVPGSRNALRHAELVRDRALSRALIAASESAAGIAWGAGDPASKLDSIAALFARLERGVMPREPRSMASLVSDALARVIAAGDGVRPDVWPTGIGPLDRYLGGGLKPGKVYGIAARPSVGKSSAARAMAIGVARAGTPVLLLSQEMPAEEVTDCVLSQLGSINSERMQRCDLRDDDHARLADAADEAGRLAFYVDDQGGLTLAEIRAKARSIRGLKALVLDYLQLSSSTLKTANTNDQIAEISKGLKRLALELKIAVVVLSQLNRDVERRVDKEPILADLRDSGAIEQDLDVCVMLWTVLDDSDESPSRLVGWKVAKHRGGPKGRFAMEFTPSVYRWSESHQRLPDHPGKSRKSERFE